MIDGNIRDMDLLQGLLIHLACSSLILQKSRYFYYTPYITRCCEYLALQNQHPTDKHLAYIVQLQAFTEKVEDITSRASTTGNSAQFEAEIQQVAQETAVFKSTLPFSLSESHIPHTLRQIVLRMEAAASLDSGTAGDHRPFHDLAKRMTNQFPTVMGTDTLAGGDLMLSQDTWAGSSGWFPGPELDVGAFLFTDPVDFSGMFVL
ncbi:hypothetical protein G7Z17_g2539 [Cylindrodendrum hubeiense]|uniref:Uncharacterized protein n=1 Tax=Cylindrodendrum hubeiense TaxID=595255 RepID=A0A9P5HJH9_9HYPO|nr:hypothetical protein G7Z17_g2539 [Cylindrodendrum hubeiense]